MRKLKLLIGAFALFVGGNNTASAQNDVTATYITNPGFEESYDIEKTYSAGTANERFIFKPYGWTVVLGNPNDNDLTCLTSEDAQSGSFSGYTMAHSGSQTYWTRLRWGGQVWRSAADGGPTGQPTSLELQQKFNLPNGVYRLSADLLCYASGTEANNHVYLKATSSKHNWQVEPTIKHSHGDDNWENKSLLITAAGTTEYTVGLQIVQNWQVETISGFDDVKLEKYEATSEDPVEITSIVPKGTGSWTNNGANNAQSFSNGGVTMVERYYNQHYTGTVSELVVSDLPLGYYDAEVYCQAHCADWSCTAIPEAAGQIDRTILSANNVEVGIPVVNDKNLTEGPQVRTLTDVVVNNGVLTFKVRNDQEGANWLTFEIKSLKYKGNAIAIYKSEYDNAKLSAQETLDNADYENVIGNERTTLTNAIAAEFEETEVLYISALSTLNTALENFVAAKSAYDDYAAMKVKAQGLISQTDSYTDPGTAVSTLNGVISAADEAASTATAATIGTQTENVKKGAFAFLANVTPKTDKLIDVTAFIVNAGFDSNGDGWSITRDGANNWSYSCGEFYEATFDINQTLSDLPAGKSFKLKVQAFQRPGEMASVYAAYAGSTDKTKNVNSEIYVNGKAQKIKNIASEYSATELWNDGTWERDSNPAEGVYVPNSMHGARTYFDTEYADGVNFYENEVAASADEDGNLKFGFRSSVKGTGTWTIFDNFRLYYAGDDLSGFAADLTSAIGSVKTAIDGLAISSYAKTTLKAQADEYEAVYATAAEYSEAIAAVNALETKGGTLVAPYAAWNEAKAAATELFPEEATGPLSVLSAKNDVVEGTIEADDITAATSLVTELCNAYSSFTTQAEAVLAVKDQDVYTDKNSALSTFTDEVSSAIATVNAATIPSAIITQEAIIISAVKTFISEVTITPDKCFDITALIVNQHFTEGLGGTSIPTGWTLESGSITEHRLATHNFEAYRTQFNLSQTISDLPKGTYKVTLQGFARHDNDKILDKTNLYCGPVNQPIKNITDEYSLTSFYSNEQEAMGDTNRDAQATLNDETIYRPNGMTGAYYWFQETNPITKQPFYTNEVQTMLAKAGDLKIGFKCETNTDWVIWDNFHLYYYGPAIKVEIDEATGKSFSTDIDEANVTLKRTIKANTWNTIMLPFDLSNAELKAAFGDDVEIAEFSEVANGPESTVSFNKMQTPELTANTPVLLKTSTAGTEYIFYGVAIKGIEGEAKVEGINYDFVGTAGSTTIANGDYFISANQIFRSTGETTILATRAYLKEKTADARIARFDIFSDETTGIAAVNGEKKAETIYNLNGQKVTKAQKGIFIQNGKKVVRK